MWGDGDVGIRARSREMKMSEDEDVGRWRCWDTCKKQGDEDVRG